MEIRHLESLVAIADRGSFSRAAVALNVAQPSLSRRIRLLETDVGQRLLVRTGRGVAPTAAGEALLVHARSMLETARRAREELLDMKADPSGRVLVGLPPRVALGLSVPLVKGFRARFPRAVITLQEGLSQTLCESLIAGRLDLALLFDPPPLPQVKYEPLLRERLLLVAPPGSRLPPRASLASLANYPMVLPNSPNAVRGVVDGVLNPRGISLNVVAEVGAMQTVLALVAQGVGCTILPESAQATSAAAARLPEALIGPPAIWNSLVLAVPLARPATRLTRETLQLLRGLDFRKSLAVTR
ncbi:MAG TPA: LysR substrate-binding domain-containing protein [Burkholderiaceae bacterium]|nr:LysR substrate-binding domain-containing protein [Burkholderiaceae bacterium]